MDPPLIPTPTLRSEKPQEEILPHCFRATITWLPWTRSCIQPMVTCSDQVYCSWEAKWSLHGKGIWPLLLCSGSKKDISSMVTGSNKFIRHHVHSTWRASTSLGLSTAAALVPFFFFAWVYLSLGQGQLGGCMTCAVTLHLHLEGPSTLFVLCYHCPEILNKLQTRIPSFLFCPGTQKLYR